MITDRALIIAAGRGIRFGDATRIRPKPLMDAAGVPLIARTILSLRRAGLDRVTVITGYRGKILEDYLRRFFPGVGWIRNTNWRRPNGHSVLRAQGEIRGLFALLMADHLFDAAILDRLMAAPLLPGRCRLAVDYHPEKVPDIEDATKIEVKDGLIRDIGKAIPRYNAVDTGIFLCTEIIFAALEQAIAQGRESLSDGIRILANAGRMEGIDIDGLFWRDVDDEPALREAENSLVQSPELNPASHFLSEDH